MAGMGYKFILCMFSFSYKGNEMSGGGTPKAKIAPLPAPVPSPQEIDVEAMRKGEDLRRKLKARGGRRGTILTEPGTLGEPLLQKSTILGRT